MKHPRHCRIGNSVAKIRASPRPEGARREASDAVKAGFKEVWTPKPKPVAAPASARIYSRKHRPVSAFPGAGRVPQAKARRNDRFALAAHTPEKSTFSPPEKGPDIIRPAACQKSGKTAISSIAWRKGFGSLRNCRPFRRGKRRFRGHISDNDRFLLLSCGHRNSARPSSPESFLSS